MYRHDVIDTSVISIDNCTVKITKGLSVSPFLVRDNLNPSHAYYRAPPTATTVPIQVLSSEEVVMAQTPTSLIESSHEATGLSIRSDLTSAHARVWEKLAAPGTWWNGSERLAIAEVVRAALSDANPVPPWDSASQSGRLPNDSAISSALQDAVYRLAVHAGTLTEEWYQKMRDATGVTPQQWVEIIEVTISVASVLRFAQVAGIDRPEFPEALEGQPTRQTQPSKPARHHWVPVVHLEDSTPELAPFYDGLPAVPPVLRALSSVPAAMHTLFTLSNAQYIPMREMIDLNWTRGTLSRRQIELVAGRLSAHRECFY